MVGESPYKHAREAWEQQSALKVQRRLFCEPYIQLEFLL